MEASRLWSLRIFFVLFVVSFFITAAPGAEPSLQSARYTFLSDRSTIVQSGGIAGVLWTYAIEGQFCLIVDAEAGIARFEQVDANAVDTSEPVRVLDPNTTFNLESLIGTVVDETTITFTGSIDIRTIELTVTFEDDVVLLTGMAIERVYDGFIFQLDATATRKYAGGTGEPDDPYRIATAAQMNAIGTDPNDWDKHFQLTANIDLSPFNGKQDRPRFNIIAPDIEPNNGLFQGTSFTGVFDGKNFAISNLRYSRHDALPFSYRAGCGLFGRVADPNSEIRNLRLVDPNIDVPTAWNVGALVGSLAEGTVHNCAVDGGIVSGNTFVGGLVGQIGSHDADMSVDIIAVSDCSSRANVIGMDVVGGLAGGNLGGIVIRCSADTHVSGDFAVGGLLGCNKKGSVIRSRSAGHVAGSHGVGGLLGTTGVCNCFCISASATADCYATAVVKGDSFVGGLIGSNRWGWLRRCFSAGPVSGVEETGGLVGANDTRRTGAAEACFWDIETSGQGISEAGMGLTTSEMQTARTFLEAGWDFVGETENGMEEIWWIDEGQDYPRLWWERDEASLEMK
jgi:hypothetical protein